MKAPATQTSKTMTAYEKQCLASMEAKFDIIRDNVSKVVNGIDTGFFLTGEGGVGKSFCVLECLKETNKHYEHIQGRVSAKGLYDTLQSSPSSVHLIEDAESMFSDKLWTGVLRNALWSQDRGLHSVRNVSWGTDSKRGGSAFVFTGGIVVISNIKVNDTKADMRAVLSRAPEVYINFNTDELLAKQKEICLKGYERPGSKVKLSVAECLEVLGFIKDNRTSLKLNIDLRTLIRGFNEYHFDKMQKNRRTWKDRIYSAMCAEVKPATSDDSWV